MANDNNSMGGVNCWYNETNFGHIYLVEDMALAVLDNRDPMICPDDGRKAVEIILAAYEFSKNKKAFIN